jgi:vacuolar-type H+-ATPase catalytic subunit A/Vma1
MLAKQRPITIEEMKAQVLHVKQYVESKNHPKYENIYVKMRKELLRLEGLQSMIKQLVGANEALSEQDKTEISELISRMFAKESEYLEENPHDYFDIYDKES